MTYLGTLKGMARQEAQREAYRMLEQVDLGENAKNKVSELSKGMQQKVQFIATFLHQPELVIVDEPFSGLDPVNTQMIKDMLYQMRSEGVTIVMSTHQMHQIEEMADRLMMIDHGRRMLYGGVDEVRQRFAKNAIIVEGDGDWAALAGREIGRTRRKRARSPAAPGGERHARRRDRRDGGQRRLSCAPF